MTETRDIPVCQPFDPDPRPARFTPPKGAVDTHFHVFGPADRYAYVPDRTYTPPEAPLAAYEHMLDTLGISRAVIIHPSVYGTDNSASLDAMRETRLDMRGIAVVDDTVSDAELRAMDEQGMRGVRVNLLFGGGVAFEAAERMARRIADLGWHLQLLIDISAFDELETRLKRLPVDTVVDHMGHMPTAKGVDHPAFATLMRLVDTGRTWVKLSGAYRITAEREAPYRDAEPFARALIDCNPERMVWATDWPHPFVQIPMPNDGALLDMLADWAPDETVRNRILVDNPARLYGFSEVQESRPTPVNVHKGGQ